MLSWGDMVQLTLCLSLFLYLALSLSLSQLPSNLLICLNLLTFVMLNVAHVIIISPSVTPMIGINLTQSVNLEDSRFIHS